MAEQVETNEAQADGMAALAELKQDAPEQQAVATPSLKSLRLTR